MLTISHFNMLMMSCKRTSGKDSKQTRRGIKALWGVWMTQNQPSIMWERRTHFHTVSPLCVNYQANRSLLKKKSLVVSSCRWFRTLFKQWVAGMTQAISACKLLFMINSGNSLGLWNYPRLGSQGDKSCRHCSPIYPIKECECSKQCSTV